MVTPSVSLCVVHSSLQKRHQVRSARVRRHTVFDDLAPLAEHSAYILVPPRPQTPAHCGIFRSHLVVICAAKPRYTAANARVHLRVLAPLLPTICALWCCSTSQRMPDWMPCARTLYPGEPRANCFLHPSRRVPGCAGPHRRPLAIDGYENTILVLKIDPSRFGDRGGLRGAGQGDWRAGR